MTTIVVDAASLTIAADKQSTTYNTKQEWVRRSSIDKLNISINNEVIVGAGCTKEIKRQVNFFMKEGHVDGRPKGDCGLIVVCRKGDGLICDTYKYVKLWHTWFSGVGDFKRETVQGSRFTVTAGSGSNYASEALKQGMSPVECVEFASKFDIYTSFETDSYTFNEG